MHPFNIAYFYTSVTGRVTSPIVDFELFFVHLQVANFSPHLKTKLLVSEEQETKERYGQSSHIKCYILIITYMPKKILSLYSVTPFFAK